MSRKLFGGWGWEASDREFGQALALLGVIAPLAWSERAPSKLTARRARVLLGRAIHGSPSDVLICDLAQLHGAVGALKLVGSAVTASELAKVWTGVYAQRRSLEIRSAPNLDDRWAFDTLARGQEASVPFFPLTEPPGRLRWRWPIRLGFLADQPWLLNDTVGRLSPTMRALVEEETDPNRADILVVANPGSISKLAAEPLPESTLVIVFDQGWSEPEPPRRLRQIAAEADARGVALIDIDDATESEWLRAFLRELSHEKPVLEAIRSAGRVRAMFAARSLVGAVPLIRAGERLTAAMMATSQMTARASPSARPPTVALPARTTAALSLPADPLVPLDRVAKRLRETNLSFANESDGATDVAAVAVASAPILDAAEVTLNEDRFIRADVSVTGKDQPRSVRRGFQAGRTHQIAVTIGPRDVGLIMAGEAIPAEALAEAIGHRLTVVLALPDLLRRPLVETIELPAFGPTDPAIFRLPVRRATTSVRGRIAILHRGRILQTAILRGPVYKAVDLAMHEAAGTDDSAPGIAILPEANLRPGLTGLDDRSRFHAAVILNHDDSGKPQGAAVGRRKAAHLGLDMAKEALAGLSAILEEAERDKAFERALGSPESVIYLTKLAVRGSSLYNRIGKAIEATHGAKVERLQVLSANPNTLLPVELIYDLPPPASRPRLCGNAREALITGRCQPSFHPKNNLGQLEVVCPSGFWGVSKIIERQATDPKKTGTGFTVWAGAARGGNLLGPLTPVLFAASDHVNDVNKSELRELAKALAKLTDKRVVTVKRWTDWAAEVLKGPPVLVLLSHTATDAPLGASLEIATAGGPEQVATGQITEAFVNPNRRKPGPLVLLLGCTTGVPLDDVQSFVVQFADRGAPVVIGTISPVLGRHAGRTAGELIGQLQAAQAAAGGRKGVPMGEVLRDVRRALLSRGILMAMSLAAYGDADWRLPARAN